MACHLESHYNTKKTKVTVYFLFCAPCIQSAQ
nr:MAG TPA: hypothetical protein [Caudoviricetes sp.]